jgi:RNA 2',3'-cyclic 3'-phosphodiesterase
MRGFVAIALEPAARREIALAEDRARAAIGASSAARWTREANLHLTVAFLGNIEEALVPAVADRLGPLADSVAPERLVLAGVGGFPRSRPRVLWLGVEVGRPWFVELAKAVRAARADGLGLELDEREPSAHVTLARVERPEPALLPALEAAFAGRRIVSQADRLTLFSSVPGRGGPTYAAEREWPFREIERPD